MSELISGPLQTTTEYGPYSKLINVYGLRILSLSDVGGQPAVQDEFLKKTAQTFKLLLNPDAEGIDKELRAKALQGLTSYNVIQRVGIGSYGSYSPSFDSGLISGWDEVNEKNWAVDFIWHLRDNNGIYSPSGNNQATENIEHALHTLSQYAFPAAFPDELNVYSSNGRADGIFGGLQDAYDEAVRNGVYDPSDYSGANDGSDGYGQLLLREYVYCLIYAEWGFTSALTEEGTLAPEWSDAHLSPSSIARDNPLGHTLFTENISKIISKPSLESLQSIFKDGDAGVSGYVPTDGESTPAPTPTPIPEKEEETVPAPDAATPDNSEPLTPAPTPEPATTPISEQTPIPEPTPISESTPIPEPTPTPLPTTLTDDAEPSDPVVLPIESEEVNLYCGKGMKKLKGKPGVTNFIFNKLEKFSNKNVDQITRFNRKENDMIHLDEKLYGLSGDWGFAKAKSKRKLNKFAKSDVDLIYFQKKGFLYINGNGEDKGFGDLDEGGLLAVLKGKPSLKIGDIQLI